MFRLSKLLLLFGFLLASPSTWTQDQNSMNDKLRALDAKSRELLGVSLKSLRFLLDDTPCTLSTTDVLERYEGRKYLSELEAAGLIRTRSFMHRPLGSEKQIELVEVKLLQENNFDDCN